MRTTTIHHQIPTSVLRHDPSRHLHPARPPRRIGGRGRRVAASIAAALAVVTAGSIQLAAAAEETNRATSSCPAGRDATACRLVPARPDGWFIPPFRLSDPTVPSNLR